MDEPKKSPLPPRIYLMSAMFCLLFCLYGVYSLITLPPTDRLIGPALGVAAIVLCGIGLIVNLWAFLVYRK